MSFHPAMDYGRGHHKSARALPEEGPAFVYTEMEALIQHFLIYSQGFNVPKGECYVPVEGPRGEHGFYIVSDGTNRPARVKARAPSFLACQALDQMVVGGLVADLIAVIGSTDVVMGDVDR